MENCKHCTGCPHGGSVARSDATDSHEEVSLNPEAPRPPAAAASHSGCSDFQISAGTDPFTFTFCDVSLREIESYHTWRAVYRRVLLTAGQGESQIGGAS